jgi:meiotically up-regulated gene 157 (Mug157) protein
MLRLRALALALVAAFAFDATPSARAADASAVAAETTLLASEKSALASKLDKLYVTAFDEAINRHARVERDGTTYVSSGDINAEWLRDAAAVMEPYIGLAGSDRRIRQVLRGVVVRMARCILIDPYANAFWPDYRVAERKFEVDSLLYPIWFAHRYWRETGDRSIFTPEVRRAFKKVLTVLRDEQRHAARSPYRHPELTGPFAPAVGFTGMIWTGFRPSDDRARYHYNIPVNMFAVVVMRELSSIEGSVYRDSGAAANAWGLGIQIERGVEQFGTVHLAGFGEIYSYEVDGRGHAILMDDANVPSLLSIPYFGYLSNDDSIYRATRKFILSDRNPYYYVGRYASGVGSPHTPKGYVWPLSLIVQALTARDNGEVDRLMGYIAASDIGDHRLHESFNADWPESFTRDDFAWPNALYAKLIQQRQLR